MSALRTSLTKAAKTLAPARGDVVRIIEEMRVAHPESATTEDALRAEGFDSEDIEGLGVLLGDFAFME